MGHDAFCARSDGHSLRYEYATGIFALRCGPWIPTSL